MKKILLTLITFFSLLPFLYPQITLVGNISEATWNVPSGTSSGGSASGLGAGHEINSLYATSLIAGEIYIATGGNVQYGKHILVFIDSLPLQFLQVNSRIIEDHSFILWSIADDTEIDHYEVEESNTGSVFHNLSIINSQQHNFKTDYIVEDNSLNIGNNFYRVKAVATNGDITYSKILKMPYGKIDNTVFVYPNPVKLTLNVQLHSLLKGYYKLHIYNNAGQEIYNRAVNHDGLDKTITLQLPVYLQKGIYRLMFINKYEFYKQNFTVE
jgi:hypothetical protein